MRVPAAVLVGALLAATGCSDAAPDDEDPTVLPGTGSDFVGARDDVDDLECRRGADGWDVTGTVRNPSGAPVDYRIYVSLLDDQDQTRDLNQVDVRDVDPGEAQQWRSRSGADVDGLRCVLRVERVGPA